MTEAEFLRRFDEHLAEIREEIRLTKEFMREALLRSDRRFEKTVRHLDQVIDRNTRAWENAYAELRELRDSQEAEARAQRAALFRMMDRLGPDPGDAPATA